MMGGRSGEMSANGNKASVKRWINPRDIKYSMVDTVDITVFLEVAMRLGFNVLNNNNNNNKGVVV